jgi:hypothetical protein
VQHFRCIATYEFAPAAGSPKQWLLAPKEKSLLVEDAMAQQQNVSRTAAENIGTGGSGQGSFVLDNNTYNVIAILHKKSEALEVYDKYLRDAVQDRELSTVLERIRQQDQQSIQQLERHLSRLLSRRGGVQPAAEDIAA